MWKRGHIYKYLEPRSRNYITGLFTGNERKVRPSEIVIDHATKSRESLLEEKRKMRKARNKRRQLQRATNERETRKMRRQTNERRILLLRNWRVLIMRNSKH